MADREIVTKIVVTAEGVTRSTGEAAAGLNKVKQAAGETARVIDQLGSTSTARLKSRLDTLSASFDSVTAAEHKFAQETLRTQRMVEEGVKRGLQNEQQAAQIMTNLRNRQIAELDRLKQAKLASAAANENVPGGRQQTAAGINVAYQFQDITMMAAAGQPVMMTALQQGTQLAGILASVDAKGGSMFKTLIGGFSSLVSWQSLVAIGLVGLSAAVIKYGIAWFEASEESAEALKKQNELIKAATAAWGDQLPSVKAVSEELDRQEKLLTGIAAITELNRREGVKQIDVASINELRAAFGAGAADIGMLLKPAEADTATDAIQTYVDALERGEATVKQYAAAQAALAAIKIPSDAITALKDALAGTEPILKATTKAMDANNLSTALLNQNYDELRKTLLTVPPALAAVKKGVQELNDLNMGLPLSPFGFKLAPNAPSFSGENTLELPGGDPAAAIRRETEWKRRETLKRMGGDVFGSNIPTPGVRSEAALDDERLAAEEKATAAAKKETDALERLRKENERLFEAEQKRLQAARDFVAAQEDKQAASELELQTFGMEEDARTRLLAQLEAEQALRKTNVELTQDQVNAYRAAAAATAENKIALQQLKEDQQALNDAQSFFLDQGKDLFGSMIEGGEKLADVLKRIVNNLADAVIQAMLFGQGPLAGLFGTKPAEGYSIGGAIGTLLGNVAKTGGGATPAQAMIGGTGWEGMRGTGALSGNMAAYAAAIQSIESGGNYQALGPIQRSGDRALGAYQIMGANLPSWSKMSFGREIGQQEFLGSREIQDRIFADRFGGSLSKYGNPQDAASVWFSGRPMGRAGGAADSLGTSVPQYVQKFNTALGQATQTTTTMAKAAGGATGDLGTFANALTQFPAAPAAPAGGSNWLGSLFGGMGSASALSPAASAAISGGWAGGLYASGAAFLGGNVIPFARGGVIDGPMLFPMARGAGLMGEAGPEAVMPLTRGANGKLGVAMSGGNTGVVIHNYSTAEVKPRENKEGTGWEVVIEDRTADRINTFGTPLNKSVRSAASGRLKRR